LYNPGINAEKTSPKTLLEAIHHFSIPANAFEYFVKVRWPKGVTCPTCGSDKVSFLKNQNRWQCHTKHDKRQFSIKVGTIFEDSPLPLEQWLVAVWLETNAKNSISSYEVARALAITQKSAWFMLHRVRLALKDGTFAKIGGNGVPVEADETFLGGKAINMHKSFREEKIRGTGGANKTPIVGLLERHGPGKSTVRTIVLDGKVNKESIHPIIHKHVEPGAQLMTDAHGAYNGLGADYIHAFIDHAEKYVEGMVHTNGLENYWSLFKRCIKGTHISIEPFHTFAYLDSEGFRFNNREFTDGQRFQIAMQGVTGRRLTYKALIGRASEAREESENSSVGQGALPN
jgi:transposase-like protein